MRVSADREPGAGFTAERVVHIGTAALVKRSRCSGLERRSEVKRVRAGEHPKFSDFASARVLPL